ncbi:MAG: hypothetical protein IJT26_04950, partial [Bacteroidales bacterium]|nr:hypothetical protein [Bacteroidales bacterium]
SATTSNRKLAAASTEKAPAEPGKETLFGDDEIEVVNPPKKEAKTVKKQPREPGIFKWTKKKFTDFMGDLYDGMEE